MKDDFSGRDDNFGDPIFDEASGRMMLHSLRRRGLWVLVCLGIVGAMSLAQTRHSTPSVTVASRQAAQGAPKLASANAIGAARELGFEPNRGQTSSAVKYLAHGADYEVFITGDAAVVRIRQGNGEVIRMRLARANPNAPIEPAKLLPGRVNYFIGNDPARWHSNIPTYARLIQRDIWPGIDLAWYGNGSRLECDFVLSPHADPHAIELAFEGADKLDIDSQGNLGVRVGDERLVLLKPVIYQEIGGTRRSLDGRYLLSGAKGRTRSVRFEIGAYDQGHALVIDPPVTLADSTYLGGRGGTEFLGGDEGNGIAVDATGVYVTGETGSVDFPLVKPEQATFGQSTNAVTNYDAFLTKFNRAGTKLIYSTYLGGTFFAEGYGVAVDSTGSAYIVGDTYAKNFPTVKPYQKNLRGAESGFVAKFNPGGNKLVYSTYLGGYYSGSVLVYGGGSTDAHAIAVDSSGSAYVTGQTYSSQFPIVNAYQASLTGTANAFVTKFNANGASLVYSTFLGGEAIDRGNGIAVDSSGSAYVTGQTSSAKFPVVNAYQGALKSPAGDAFVTKLRPDGLSLVYSTYLGGSSTGYRGDYGRGIAVDSAGDAYVTGQTRSADFPTLNPFQSQLNCVDGNAFLTELDPSGSALIYSTYLGGSGNPGIHLGDSGNSVAVDSTGSAYITGRTTSADFPILNASQLSLKTVYGDAFVTEFSPGGETLVYSTYLGGSGNSSLNAGDTGNAIAVDPNASAFVTGQTSSPDFPTVSPFQAALLGPRNAFVAEFISPP